MAVLVLIFCAPAMAEEARLTNIILTDTPDALRLFLAVEGSLPSKTEETIQNGVPVSFSFSIRLYRSIGFWPDKKIVDIFLTHSVKYNSLKKSYEVSRSWDEKSPMVVYSFDAAKKLMTEIDGLDIIALSRLERGNRYQLQAKATLQQITLPYYLHHVLFFVSLWNIETDWYTIDFIY
ncbi:DUF4390 domain-containing protein [Desulfosarcina sp. OttesenSCG-928-A07]|nr:DUF4390 domain-containing protein [Desulfosarcina sp. OttesenSCG-928-A07]